MTSDPLLRIVDAEAGGDISRIIVDGMPPLGGASVAEQRDDFAARFDHLRWKLIQPPHGELHMCPVLLLKDIAEDADFGVIIMESMGYPPISGSNLFCATAVALEAGLVEMREPSKRLRVATPGGVVNVTAHCRNGRCGMVEFENTPAFVKNTMAGDGRNGGYPPLTVVTAGVDYAAVDAEQLGLDLEPSSCDDLRRQGDRLAARAGTDFVLFHQTLSVRPDTNRCRVAVFQQPSVICRSPTGTGTSAMLVLGHAGGVLRVGDTLTTRSPAGGEFRGRIVSVNATPDGDVLHTTIAGPVHTGRSFTIA